MPELYPSLDITQAPRMSLLYIPDNLNRLLEGYGAVIILLAAALLTLLFNKSSKASNGVNSVRTGLFLAGTTIITLIIGLTYVNPHVTFRYYGILAPVFSIAIMMSALNFSSVRQRIFAPVGARA